MGAELHFLRRERPADDRLAAEDVEEVAGDARAPQALGLVPPERFMPPPVNAAIPEKLWFWSR